MFPKKFNQWKFSAYDTIGGIGGMNNYVVCVRNRDSHDRAGERHPSRRA